MPLRLQTRNRLTGRTRYVETIATLTSRNATPGLLQWIGIRPARRSDVEIIDSAQITNDGIQGDHYTSGGKRTVTLVQYEHLAVIASLLGKKSVSPVDLRRNLVVSSINMLGLRNRQFMIGDAVLEGTGLCAPCSRMEEIFGPGGYTAVRGHGGITARVVKPGKIQIGDEILPL